MYNAIQRCSQVYFNMVAGRNLTKDPPLLCRGEKSKSINSSVKQLYSHSLPLRILDAHLYFWEKWRSNSSSVFCHCHHKGVGESQFLCERGVEREQTLRLDLE